MTYARLYYLGKVADYQIPSNASQSAGLLGVEGSFMRISEDSLYQEVLCAEIPEGE